MASHSLLPSRCEIELPTYSVVVGRGLLASAGEAVERVAPAHRYAVITDDVVAAHHADRVVESIGRERARLFVIPSGETQKTRERWGALTDEMLADGFGRDSAVVALGGGVIGDLAGFVAATYMRGIPVVQLPTTLLAMIDASIGGKTGVDTPAGKNLVGAFHQPAGVFADPDVLSTLPPAQRRAGMAEALKHGVVADAGYFDLVASAGPAVIADPGDDHVIDLVVGSVSIKAGVVRRDEREGGIRKILNFGHTLGHAVEHASGYGLLHGEAVAIGMVLESAIAERIRVGAPGISDRIRNAIGALGLPTEVPSALEPSRLLAATRGDKKSRRGVVEYALPSAIGAMAGADRDFGIPVPDDVVLEVLEEAAAS